MFCSPACLVVLFLLKSMRKTAEQTLPKGFRHASYEVTTPRKLTPGSEPRKHLTYLMQIEGKDQILHLKQKKGLIPKQFPIFTYSSEGDLQLDYPYIRDDCFYHGFVQGKPDSVVTVSICSDNLRGLLQLDNKTYEIEPVPVSPTFQHVVYSLEEQEDAVPMSCGLTEEEQTHQEAMVLNRGNIPGKPSARKSWSSHGTYVKIAIVIEHERFIRFHRNETFVANEILDIMHFANSLFKPLYVQLSAAGLEIWSEKNHIQITDNIHDTLKKFTDWRKESLVKRLVNDVGHLFIYKSFGNTFGSAYLGAVCSTQWASGIVSYVTSNLFHFSNAFAHELGHTLGMLHDGKYCTCEQHACIMAAVQVNTGKFSNCSYNDYYKLRNIDCLLIPPDPEKTSKSTHCGNKIVEGNEDCDCGSPAECELDPCCRADCMFRLDAACAFGQCCAKCQYLPAQTLCRENISICDLPEYCNGISEWCPEDVHVQDGAPCHDGAYCYHGHCTTHTKQCKMIFGRKATVASDDCFRVLNARGDSFGNCGLKRGIYSKCNAKNILCGRIHCDNINKLPSLDEHSTIIQMPIGDRQCWGTEHHHAMDLHDDGIVRDGTPCGTDMMCINGECVSVSLLKYDCNATKCYNRGMCNTYKNCHCDYGWAPPDCLNKGYGGSIDSGPPPRRTNLSRVAVVIGIICIVFLILILL